MPIHFKKPERFKYELMTNLVWWFVVGMVVGKQYFLLINKQ